MRLIKALLLSSVYMSTSHDSQAVEKDNGSENRPTTTANDREYRPPPPPASLARTRRRRTTRKTEKS
jgi:hypothetical protein